MRALQVLGVSGDGSQLMLADPKTGEEFAVAADDKLRAAARGDASRIGQLEIEMESQLRPKEIQSRIRAGATVAEVAAAAGTSINRVERFAYPVLMERSAMAQRGVGAHPVGPHGPVAITIGEVVAATLHTRGHKGGVDWDAYKDDAGWVLVASWKAGRSENRAGYLLHLGADGGTVTPRDDFARDLLDPAPKPLRTVRPEVTAREEIPAPGEPVDITATTRIPRITDAMLAAAAPSKPAAAPPAPAPAPASAKPAPGKPADAAPSGHPAATPVSVASVPARPAPATAPAVSSDEDTSVSRFPVVPPHRPTVAPTAQDPTPATDSAAPAVPQGREHVDTASDSELVESTVTDDRSGAAGRPAEQTVARTGTEGAAPRPRKAGRGKPSMPSWDDVLLGSGVKRR